MLLGASLIGLVLVAGCGDDAPSLSSTTAEQESFDDCATTDEGPASVFGFDPVTGQQRWSRLAGTRGSLGQSLSGQSGSVVGVDGVLVAAGESDVVGYDAATGAALWCRPRSLLAPSFATVSGTLVLIRTAEGVDAVDGRSGETVWSAAVGPVEGGEQLSVRGGEVLILGNEVLRRPDEAPELPKPVRARLDVSTGAAIDGPVEAPANQQVDDLTAVTVTAGFDEMVVSDPVSGIERWRVGTPFQTSVILDRDLVLVSSLGVRQPRVVAYDAASGAVRWEADIPSPAILVSRDLVVSGRAEDLVALDRDTGRQLWEARYDTPGRSERYSEPGWVPGISIGADGDVAAGVIVAMQPHRD